MTSPILWQNENHTINLVDIPRSIAAAQGTTDYPCNDQLLSTEPLQTPFPSNEPKSAAAKAKVEPDATHQDVHDEYARLCADAIEQVKLARSSSPWCLPRMFAPAAPAARKHEREDEGSSVVLPPGFNVRHLARFSELPLEGGEGVIATTVKDGPIISNVTLLANRSDDQIMLPMHSDHGASEKHFLIPPKSSFCLGDCGDAQDFRAAIREQAEQHDTPRTFDFILLDPPWPNRSVRRTHKTAGSTYKVTANIQDIEDLLYGMDVEMLMANECLVGVWTTNKQAVRELVLAEGGLFDTWGVQLAEEWIWLKTTINGEPVTPLDAVWRKPYEVLLLGRKGDAQYSRDTNVAVKRRVMLAAPDLHSRKPCLKDHIETLLRNSKDYRALEVFARHLVAGWWSWGNECIKFNSAECWMKKEEVAD
ncbi:hypothetical protein LTR97_004393 [Elasticomyces elasticus]|uniref:MT-A70-domain-containing protein n=1 Tax=Elasticomyces elasticus TaxID=574655 RepID=A0AAN7ZUD7_9PEZI|nr:hypothetical protein LTR97_004393 [Elasticomyces elasticus]